MAVTLRPEIAALQPYRQGRPAAPDAFKLSSNENPYPPHPAVVEAIAAASVERYPDAAATALRARLATIFGVEADRIHVGSGSVALLQQLILAAAGPGDEVAYSWRSFEAYPGLVTVAGATSVTVPNRADGGHDLPALAAAITDRTRAVIVCTPNNPTGPIVTADEFAAFMDAVPPTLLVLLDEAYREFVTDPAAVDGVPLLERHPNLVVLRTFSKAYGLAGLRVGYALGPVEILNAARSTAIPLSVTEPAQRAAIAALDHDAELRERVAELIERRDRLRDALRAQGWSIPEPQGNFLWLATGEHSPAAAEILEKHGIVARVFPEGIRVSVGEEESVEPLLRSAEEVVRTLPLGAGNAGLG
ncbi:histidinol-phosphate transaminase [Schumannella sp. 10F1B-5-1]|uniref:histidinol-phosphate transaminase n=1 Tax=Schumannella sp. 10F1B-5-1 TaxID=2590780 RepID=UPI0011326B97|nr:histidinol-phosphate transaminase [Schumannella sp. 10F1B-5-1]TPW76808.1 aminotransferase class I/II-fold pyridoxal phosphate-dependent enzyme [Schumannella sp. 10F1B-5-1]